MSTPSKPVEALKEIFNAHSELDQQVCTDLVGLYDRKLWHELSLKLRETVFDAPVFQPYLQDIFQRFISEFAFKMNLLAAARFAHDVAKRMDKDAAVALLTEQSEGMKSLVGVDSSEPRLLLSMSIAEHHLDVVHMDECKASLEAGLKQLDAMSEVDPTVSAAVHNVEALHAKARQDFTGYYRAALRYLCFVSLDALPAPERLALARDVALAALLGDRVYNFAELLLHPVVKALDGSPYAWLAELLHCFSEGNTAAFDTACRRHAAAMNAQPALVAAERAVRQKLLIMCLVALVSALPPDARKIPLATIAARTHLDVDGVEFLLMRAFSLGLLDGTIDEVASSVHVTRVAPRVLQPEEIGALQAHLRAWATKVDAAAALLEAEMAGPVATVA